MSKRPNVLLFMVDEQRYPTPYDGPVLRDWLNENLPAQRHLRERGVEATSGERVRVRGRAPCDERAPHAARPLTLIGT